ncbi:TAP C-terminal domain family protein [Candida albicans]|uniref:TAP C-terminal domain family protein n=1 Tax=Candida albicans TaxID=5476 RepID=A0A8H6BYW9_CANAX|nr:TAP C-terminal domain family protein [Candida albicans]
MSYRGRGGGYNNNRGQFSSGPHQHQQNVDSFVAANQYPIEIMGWNGASSGECINFISRKCKVIVSNYSVDSNSGVLKGYVKNESQANTLLNWSGVKFAGQSLRFSKGIPTRNQDVKSKQCETGSNFDCQGFFGSLSVSSKFFPALMKVASDLKLDVDSIDLSNNELQDLQTLTVDEKFPEIGSIDGEILRNEQVLIANLSFPFESPETMFFQDEDSRNLATNFIANYLKLWDANRSELMILYQNESQFSMQVDSSHPHLIESGIRNLTRVSSIKARMAKLSIGQEQIYKSFQQLPKTRHDIIATPELFSMEVYKFPTLNGIMITLHGSFDEVAQPEVDGSASSAPSGPRGGSRTFVVIPGPNGSMIVASDTLLIRPYTSVSATSTPSPLPPTTITTPQLAPPGTGPTTADLPADIKARLNQIQQELLVKILLETKLNINYGIMLCEQSNWDYQQASVNFKNSAASLPSDAFVQ